jgi:hypothetical protein
VEAAGFQSESYGRHEDPNKDRADPYTLVAGAAGLVEHARTRHADGDGVKCGADNLMEDADALMEDADALVERADAVMVDPDELMGEPDKPVVGGDGLVEERDGVLASPFTLVGEGSALHARADVLVADPYVDRAKGDSMVARPHGDRGDADGIMEEGDAEVDDAVGRLPIADGHHAECFARLAIADRFLADAAEVMGDPSAALAGPAEPGFGSLPYIASRFATLVVPKRMNAPASARLRSFATTWMVTLSQKYPKSTGFHLLLSWLAPRSEQLSACRTRFL